MDTGERREITETWGGQEGTQTTGVDGAIQTRNGTGNAAGREAHRPKLSRAAVDGRAGEQVAARIRGESAGLVGDKTNRGNGAKRPGGADCRTGASGWAVDEGEGAAKKRNELAGSTTAEKRARIDARQAQARVHQRCAGFDCRRSTYYYRPVQRDETALLAAIEQVWMRRAWFGYRRVVAQFRLAKRWSDACGRPWATPARSGQYGFKRPTVIMRTRAMPT